MIFPTGEKAKEFIETLEGTEIEAKIAPARKRRVEPMGDDGKWLYQLCNTHSSTRIKTKNRFDKIHYLVIFKTYFYWERREKLWDIDNSIR